MRLLSLALLLTAFSPAVPAADLNGTWKAVFTDSRQSPKGFSEVILDLKVAGDRLSGKAHVGNGPDSPLVDGAVSGDRFSFTVFGNSPWWAFRTADPTPTAIGISKMIFKGTLQGDQMKLTLAADSVMLYGDKPKAAPHEFPMSGTKTSE
jgi:hypothetical protein